MVENLGDRVIADANLVKGGETAIHLGFRRSVSGLTLTVKTLPLIEEWFRNLSTGELSDVKGIGRYWGSLKKDDKLEAYNLTEPIPIINLDSRRSVRFDWLAKPLVTSGGQRLQDDLQMPGGGGSNKSVDINLAFLRLVGIGADAGVTFKIAGVFSEDATQIMRDHLLDGCREFYKRYMKPVNMEGDIILEPVVQTQEWRP